jgi:ribosomal protein S21
LKLRSAASSAPSRKTGACCPNCRSREFYEKPTAERKRKLAAAVKRHHKRLRSQTLPPKMY